MTTKFIFITGGVVSSLGKGISSASIGALLEARGLKLAMIKLDPYINVDPGTLSPLQHGEVFVTEDGTETDLDLGHYERFTQVVTDKNSNFTTGQIYHTVIEKERNGEYLGRTVQVIPHITDQIKDNLINATKDCDVALVEIGGTVGDIESLPFLESIRQFQHEFKRRDVMYVHLTLIPWIPTAEELKTKPTQHSVNKLREIGIQPDILICRTDRPLDKEIKKKISLFTNVGYDAVVTAQDVKCIYELPLHFHEEGLDEKIAERLELWTRRPNLQAWADIVDSYTNPEGDVTIAIVGKYVNLKDSYKSLTEALSHAAMSHRLKLHLKFIDAEEVNDANCQSLLADCDGILIPGGFGERGLEGKIAAVKYSRENKVPYFGICLGMQVAVIEYARNVLGLKDANSAEFVADGNNNVIDLMAEQKEVKKMGGTMRLGAYPCKLEEGTKIAEVYGSTEISERHRHRYEVNNKFVDQLVDKGLVISGKYTDCDLVESIELEDHPWYIGVQAHPEFKSKPIQPHPLFTAFVAASFASK
jgi:CTP synthase